MLLFGGIETTEGMIANAIAHLLAHPDAARAVRAEPELLANAIEESLRLEPAAAVIDRYATRDAELAGAAIRERELVVVSIAGANRDPSVFPDPDRFDVRRPNAKLHAAFAHGPHVCIGMHLARLEAQTAVARVLERLPGLRLEPGDPPGAARARVPQAGRAARALDAAAAGRVGSRRAADHRHRADRRSGSPTTRSRGCWRATRPPERPAGSATAPSRRAVARMLKLTGALTIAVGVVLVAVALAT